MSDFLDLEGLPPLRDVIAAHNLRAEKALGQNFLLDQNVTDKIARCAGGLKGFHVIEVGPGPGGLTRSLLKAGAQKVTAIEFDPRAVGALKHLEEKAAGRLCVLKNDALRFDFMGLQPRPLKIVANLPYNIATPLLVGWLKDLHECPGIYHSMTLMFQKEVAKRITAAPGNKDYGRLSVLSQWLCQARIMFDLSPAAFTPPPKVKSAIVHFIPKEFACEMPSFEVVEKITAAAFGQRRKMIRSSLSDYREFLEYVGISPDLRAENLSVEEFLKLASRVG